MSLYHPFTNILSVVVNNKNVVPIINFFFQKLKERKDINGTCLRMFLKHFHQKYRAQHKVTV